MRSLSSNLKVDFINIKQKCYTLASDVVVETIRLNNQELVDCNINNKILLNYNFITYITIH